MKKLISLLLCLLLLTGCAETYDGPTETKYALTEYTVTHYYSFFDWAEESYTSRTVYAYDIYGNRVRSMEYRDGELESVSNMKYDDRGNLISEKDWDHTKWIPLPDGGRTFTYDDQNRLLTTVYYGGWGKETSRSTYTYDDEARIRTWSNDSGDVQTTWMDENGRELRQTLDKYETVYEYDENGNLTGSYSYENGALIERYEARYDDQNRQTWGGRYDADGQLKTQTNWEYDEHSHTVTTTRPDGNVRIEYYHADGRLYMIEDYSEDGTISMLQQYYYQEIQVPAKEATP